MLNSNPTIHVYASALSKFKSSGWAEYGTIVGDLDEWEEATSIESIQNPEFKIQDEGEVYNLNGQRISKPGKGLYIVGGRKVVMR